MRISKGYSNSSSSCSSRSNMEWIRARTSMDTLLDWAVITIIIYSPSLTHLLISHSIFLCSHRVASQFIALLHFAPHTHTHVKLSPSGSSYEHMNRHMNEHYPLSNRVVTKFMKVAHHNYYQIYIIEHNNIMVVF